MEQFRLNNREYQLQDVTSFNLHEGQFSDFEIKTLSRIQDWFSGNKSFVFQTSGSTAKPKSIEFSREQIIASARRTIKAFHLTAGQKILCCLNTKFVAGFMMLIRAFEADLQLKIIEPNSNPLDFIDDQIIDFVAMTPIQVQGALSKNLEKFRQIKILLVGGAGLHPELEERLSQLDCSVFHSFAMTETLTHVAIRNIGQKDHNYHAVEGVTFGKAQDDCLIVNDNLLKIQGLKTNDIVELEDDQTFRWIGRSDNIVNSGGIKIQIDVLELKIREWLLQQGIANEICLVSIPEERLTNKLILLIEEGKNDINSRNLLVKMKSALPVYHDPKEIRVVSGLFQTSSGKMDRLKNINAYL